MSDIDREHLTVPSSHCIFAQHPAPGSYTGATTITSNSGAPPFAPRPVYNPKSHHGTAPSSRSGGTSTHTDHVALSAVSSQSSTECNCHEVCYYLQQAFFILAIMTGVALIIAGTVLHVQSNELLVLVFIGFLLTIVNGILLLNLCCTRVKQKHRARARASQSSAQAVIRYKNSSTCTEKATVTQTLMNDPLEFQYKHFGGAQFHEFSVFAPSPNESQLLHQPQYQRSGSVVSHHRYLKGLYQKSPPLGQYQRPLLNTLGPQRLEMGQQSSYSPSAPPPSYDDLLRTGRLPQDGTIVHLI